MKANLPKPSKYKYECSPGHPFERLRLFVFKDGTVKDQHGNNISSVKEMIKGMDKK